MIQNKTIETQHSSSISYGLKLTVLAVQTSNKKLDY